MYSTILLEFIPINSTGNASHTNSCSHSIASFTKLCTVSSSSFSCNLEYNKQAKSVCNPSSRAINSLECPRPGINPRFFNQKIAQKLALKNIPSTQANATKR